MKTDAIRDKPYDYIRVVDDKTIMAIYAAFENEIGEEVNWWEDNDFVKELDTCYNEWKNGKSKGYTLEEVNASIDKLRIKRNRQ